MKKFLLFVFTCYSGLSLHAQLSFKEIQLPVGNRVNVKAEEATLRVKENRVTGKGEVVLSLVRLKGTNVSLTSYPILWLAGGPGVPGIASAREDMYAVLNALREVGDVILIDQRGTGQSTPSLRYEGERFKLPLNQPINSTESQERLMTHLKTWKNQLDGKGIDLSAYNTLESARDLDDIRIALGANKVNLFAHSYGTHLALAYIKNFGNHVNRAVLGGVNGLDQRYRLPAEGDALFQRLDSLIKNQPGMKKLMPDFYARTKKLIAQLDEKPVLVKEFNGSDRASGPVLISGFDLQVTLALVSGDTNTPMDLPAVIFQAEQGDFKGLASFVYGAVKNREFPTAMSFSMHCASGAPKYQLQTIAQQSGASILGNAVNYPFSLAGFCEVLGVTDLGDEFRKPFKSNIPVLFFSGSLDGRTSTGDAERVRDNFTNSRHIVIKGSAHQVFTSSPEVVKKSIDFFKGIDPAVTTLPMSTFGFRSPLDADIQEKLTWIYKKEGIKGVENHVSKLLSEGELVGFSLLNGMALRWQQTGKKDESMELMLLNAKFFPAHYMNYRYIAQLYARIENRVKAEEFYSKALQLNPYDFGSLAALGKLK
jgi:pimeloyl-ACP methyl ester carboxylesterase